MKLRLLKPHDYNGKRYNIGEEIEPSRSIGEYLVRMKVGEEITDAVEEVHDRMINTIGDSTHAEFAELISAREALLTTDKKEIDYSHASITEKEQLQREIEKVEMNPIKNEKKKGRPKSKK